MGKQIGKGDVSINRTYTSFEVAVGSELNICCVITVKNPSTNREALNLPVELHDLLSKHKGFVKMEVFNNG
jgi:hypothetical protein